MSRLEALLSRHQPGSALSRLNRDGRLTNADPALVELVQQAHQLSAQSSGAFDITIKPLGDLYREHHQQGAIPSPAAIAETLPLVNYKNIPYPLKTTCNLLPYLTVYYFQVRSLTVYPIISTFH